MGWLLRLLCAGTESNWNCFQWEEAVFRRATRVPSLFRPISHTVDHSDGHNPVQFIYAETRGTGKHRNRIESRKSASRKQPPPCGCSSRRARQVRRRKVRHRVAPHFVNDGTPKNGGCSK